MQTIYIDISNKNVIPTIYAKQGEIGRKFLAVLTDGSVPYSFPAGYAFSVWYDGDSGEGNYTHIGEKSAFSVDGNKVAVEMIAQMLSVPGEGKMCLVLNYGENQTATWNIEYVVESVPGAESEEAEEYYTAFSQTVSELPYPDESLSVPGKAADAAATGAALDSKAPAGYGLGTTTQKAPNDDPNEITKTGFYSAQHANLAPNSSGRSHILHIEYTGGYAIQFQFDLNESIYAVRKKLEGVWQAWEFENPPMAAGIEYRTTERWENKPVYRKLVKHTSEGVISGDSRYDIDHGISNMDRSCGVQILARTTGYQLPYISAGESTAVTGCTATKIEIRTTGSTNWSAGRTWCFDMKYVKNE